MKRNNIGIWLLSGPTVLCSMVSIALLALSVAIPVRAQNVSRPVVPPPVAVQPRPVPVPPKKVVVQPVLVKPLPPGPQRGGILNIRLALAEENVAELPVDVDQELQDVLPLLLANLRYSGYRLIDNRDMVLQPETAQELPHGFVVLVDNIEQLIMTVTINRHDQSLLRTKLRLQVGRPLIVGPFRNFEDETAGTSAFILIFTLKN